MQGDFRIGEWRVQPQINCVQKNGASVHLEPKVMQVLVLLAANQGEVVSKERILHTVWSGVFVGEDVLTRSISEIRRVMADDARSPRVIQTIPKAGYRMIASVSFDPALQTTEATEPAAPPSPPPVATEPAAVAPIHLPPESTAVHSPESRNRRGVVILFTGVVLCILAGISIYWYLRSGRTHRQAVAAYRTVPFTSYPGSEGQAAFSPDGNEIAFVWNGEPATNKNLYVKMLGTASPLRLTTDAADDVSPAWSPDGRYIAYIRRSGTENAIYIVPAIGGPARKVSALSDSTSWEYGGLTWSSDGQRLIFPDRPSPQDPSSLFSISLQTLERTRVTNPPSSWDGDWTPAMSPDGKMIAFTRGPETAVRDVYVMDSAGGKPRQLTRDGRLVLGLAWTTDGGNVVFSSNRDGGFSLWRIPVSGGAAERLEAGGENAYSPAISPKGNLLAYSHGTGKWDIVRVDLRSSARKVLIDQILSSNEQDSAPQYSPDGTRIAFQSWRSGFQEIWLCSADGSNPVQLTSFGGALTGSPHWSPDGSQIAFDSRPDGRSHIYLIAPDGGVPRALTGGNFNDIVPSWSPDGKSIYFGSNRSGNWQIWKVPAAGGDPQPLSTRGGMIALPSADGRWVYYAKSGIPGLWRVPLDGKDEQRVLKSPPNGFQGYWGLTKDGIYYLDTEGMVSAIDYVSFAAPDQVRHIHVLDRQPTLLSGLSVSPDGRWLIYAAMAEASSNITLVENFQ